VVLIYSLQIIYILVISYRISLNDGSNPRRHLFLDFKSLKFQF